jgi:hypothetical protein
MPGKLFMAAAGRRRIDPFHAALLLAQVFR